MNKTLKILMAIILFAVVLTIATSVSAATLTTLENAGKVVKGETQVADKITYTTTDQIAADDVIEIKSGNVELVVNDEVGTIKVASGATLTIAEESTANVAKIENAGTLVLEGTKNVNAISITSATSKTISAYPIAYANGDPKSVESSLGYYVMEADGEDTLYMCLPLIKGETYIVDVNDEKVTSFEAGKKYTVKLDVKYTYNKVEYTAALETVKITATSLTQDELDSLNMNANFEFTMTEELADKAFTVTLGYKAADDKINANTSYPVEINGTVTPNPDDNQGGNETPNPDDNQGGNETPNPDDNQGATEQPGNTDNKSDDLDDSPKTGDHIIPATALLAVVVVANVVYFAKAKRS